MRISDWSSDVCSSDLYERRKDSFTTRGTRTIEQLTYPDREMAEAAVAQLKDGTTTFDQLVADQGKQPADVLLGDFTRDNMPDASLADAAVAVTTTGGETPVVAELGRAKRRGRE